MNAIGHVKPLLRLLSWCPLCLNSLSPGRSECYSKNGIFNLVLLIGIFRSSYDSALRWMPQDLTDDKSTLVQVMAWCRQATSHYLSQCWLSPLSPYGVARPQWVLNSLSLGRIGSNCQSVISKNMLWIIFMLLTDVLIASECHWALWW